MPSMFRHLVENSTGDVDEEIHVLEHTFSTTPDPPTVGPTEQPTEEATTNTIFVFHPLPDQIITGRLM